MITTNEIRSAKLKDLFCATIQKELTWEEAEEYPFTVEGFPECSTASELLSIAVELTIEELGGEVSEMAVRDIEEEVKKEILSDLIETQDTILLKKDGKYYDLAYMEILDSRYKIIRIEPLYKYGTEKDFSIEEGKFSVEEGVFEKYLNENNEE